MRRYVGLASLGAMLGCGAQPTDDTSEPLEDSGAPVASSIEGRDCPPDSPLTYRNFGEGLMLDHCTGCHGDEVVEGERSGAPITVNLTTQSQVQDWLERVYARSADTNTTMPIVDTISTDDRWRLGDWLACGAP